MIILMNNITVWNQWTNLNSIYLNCFQKWWNIFWEGLIIRILIICYAQKLYGMVKLGLLKNLGFPMKCSLWSVSLATERQKSLKMQSQNNQYLSDARIFFYNYFFQRYLLFSANMLSLFEIQNSTFNTIKDAPIDDRVLECQSYFTHFVLKWKLLQLE